jgi:hypothetical protein
VELFGTKKMLMQVFFFAILRVALRILFVKNSLMVKFFKAAMTLLTFLIIGGMGLCIYLLSLPGGLPEIDGRDEILAGRVVDEKLFDRMKLAFNSKTEFVVSEEQLNQYMASRLKVSQGGKLQRNVSVKGVWVNLTENNVTFYLERHIEVSGGTDEKGNTKEPYKQDHITKLNFEITEQEKSYTTVTTGQTGGIPLKNKLVKLVDAPFHRIAEIFKEELKLYEEMLRVKVKVEEGRIIMSSKFDEILIPTPSTSGNR